MNKETRNEWRDEFEKIGSKISELAYELSDNKDPKEFIDEMLEHKMDLEKTIASFNKVNFNR